MPSCLYFLYDLGPITIPSRHLHHVTPQRQYKEKGTTTQRGLDRLQLGLSFPFFPFTECKPLYFCALVGCVWKGSLSISWVDGTLFIVK